MHLHVCWQKPIYLEYKQTYTNTVREKERERELADG